MAPLAVAGTGTTVGVHFVPRYADFPKFQAAVIVWLVGAAVCDTTITIALTYHLVRASYFASTLFSDCSIAKAQDGILWHG